MKDFFEWGVTNNINTDDSVFPQKIYVKLLLTSISCCMYICENVPSGTHGGEKEQ